MAVANIFFALVICISILGQVRELHRGTVLVDQGFEIEAIKLKVVFFFTSNPSCGKLKVCVTRSVYVLFID